MFALGFLNAIIFLFIPSRSAITPVSCYSFLSAAGPAVDECGSGPSLSPIGKRSLTTLAGSGGSPNCDSSGCIMDQNSSFQTTFPTGFNLDWTLSIWAVLDGPAHTLL